jgi:Flp pilus assembly pilin Flp
MIDRCADTGAAEFRLVAVWDLRRIWAYKNETIGLKRPLRSTGMRRRRRWFRRGQGLVEYALILVLVSIIAIGALRGIFGHSAGPYNRVANALP